MHHLTVEKVMHFIVIRMENIESSWNILMVINFKNSSEQIVLLTLE